MRTYHGVVKNDGIVLPEGMQLPDGQEVEARVISPVGVAALGIREVGG